MSTIGTGTRTVVCKYCKKVECFWAFFQTSLARAREGGAKARPNLIEATPVDGGDLVVLTWSNKNAVVRRLAPDEIAKGVDESRFRPHRPYCRPSQGGAR